MTKKTFEYEFGSGEKVVFYPLTLRLIEQFGEASKSMQDSAATKRFDFSAMLDVFAGAANRRGPVTSAEKLRDLIEIGDIQPIMFGIMEVSGMPVPAGGKETAEGPTSPRIGGESTQA